ncbi:MAG: 23S rRNA (guanosine(2251)-2'-O)-methyltransferase RlmB [Bacillaceae bacterium]|nr:23S rRNA (guanosine(2251)-2'-O)-methyltransferase RlmB [Bacillaceae bacterium]
MSDWIVGKNPVLEALRSGRTINKIWVGEGSQKGQMKDILKLARQQGIVVQDVPRKKLDQLASGQPHQGVAASVSSYDYADFEEMIRQARESDNTPFLLILDELEDPHNLGSILRTADAVGVHGVIIPKRRSVGLTSVVAKASAGAIEYVPVSRVTNIPRVIDQLKEEGFWVVGSDADAKDDYREVKYDMPVALVIGSEGKGMSRLVREKCDFLIRLPMKGNVSSLNASVAAALMMYEVYRQRYPLENG